MHNHRVTCTECSRTWRENCVECAHDTAARHRSETGHSVELSIITAESLWELRDLTRRAQAVLTSRMRGW